MVEVEKGDGADEPTNKRAWLESVIPTVPVPAPSALPSMHGAALAPPIPREVPTQLWLSGQLPSAQRGSGKGGKGAAPNKEASTEVVGARGAHAAAN